MRDDSSTLKQEAALVGAYLAIMQTRLGKRLAYAIDVPAGLEDASVPPGMVITLVENAIKHGIEPCCRRRQDRCRSPRRWDGADRADGVDSGAGVGRRRVPGRASVLPTSASASRCCTASARISSSKRTSRAASWPASCCRSSGADAKIAVALRPSAAVAMNRPTALIAEDEPLMRERLKERLAEAWPELDIVAEAADGDEALARSTRIARSSRSSTSACRDARGSTSRPRSVPTATWCSSPRTTNTRCRPSTPAPSTTC